MVQVLVGDDDALCSHVFSHLNSSFEPALPCVPIDRDQKLITLHEERLGVFGVFQFSASIQGISLEDVENMVIEVVDWG